MVMYVCCSYLLMAAWVEDGAAQVHFTSCVRWIFLFPLQSLPNSRGGWEGTLLRTCSSGVSWKAAINLGDMLWNGLGGVHWMIRLCIIICGNRICWLQRICPSETSGEARGSIGHRTTRTPDLSSCPWISTILGRLLL